MAYPFKKMKNRELRKLSRDSRHNEISQKKDPYQKHDREINPQEDICKN